MKKLIIALYIVISVASVPAFSSEHLSKDKWAVDGSFRSKVLPLSNDDVNKFNVSGLTVDCQSRNDEFRISIADITASKWDLIKWETNKTHGSFKSMYDFIARTSNSKGELNREILSAIKSGNWIRFTNTATGSEAIYTLKNSKKAIENTKYCK